MDRHFFKNRWRSLALPAGFAVGALLPQLAAFQWSLRYLIALMLYPTFLQLDTPRGVFRPGHWRVVVMNLAAGPLAWGALMLAGYPELALAAFFIGIAPTATAAPVVMGFLGGRIDVTVGGFLLTTLCMALAIPLMLPGVTGRFSVQACFDVFGSLGFVVGMPLAAAVITRLIHPAARAWGPRLRNASFGLWVVLIAILAAASSKYLRTRDFGTWGMPLAIAILAAVMCTLHFFLGHRWGDPSFRRESSQLLGQKNTGLTIYLALVYADPATALGPTFYILWHNLWNAVQLAKVRKISEKR